MGADLASSDTAGFSSLPLLKVTTALTSSVLSFGSLVSLFHSFLSDVAVTGREPSLFLNPAAAGWIFLKFQNTYCPISC